MRFAIAVLLAFPPLASAQPLYLPEPAMRQTILEKTAELAELVEALKVTHRTGTACDLWADVAVYLKAIEWTTRHKEWYASDSGKQALLVVESGLARAKALKVGKAPWRDVRGKPVVRAYLSWVDGSIQPYSLFLPVGFGTDGKKYRKDIVLHGRDPTLTEVKFIAARERAKIREKNDGIVIIEPYGRGNNAFRWAGESDVEEVMLHAGYPDIAKHIDDYKPVVRGFSMGGAGAWHIGLHRPFDFSAMSPGAGFTVTRGYVKSLPEPLPDYVERCLHIYDAADYAENLANIPCIAYSGEKDPQIAATRNVQSRIKDDPVKLRFEHIVGTGLGHKMPPEWWAKVDAQIRSQRASRADAPARTHFVTYTTRYSYFGFGAVISQREQYSKSQIIIDANDRQLAIQTRNVSSLSLNKLEIAGRAVTLDGQKMQLPADAVSGWDFRRTDAGWIAFDHFASINTLRKWPGHQGPIDDAFAHAFHVIASDKPGWNAKVDQHLNEKLARFDNVWDKYMRGKLPRQHGDTLVSASIVLFGDPASNAEIARVLRHLPIKWTNRVLEVNGKRYDSATHYPVMIYPVPGEGMQHCIVLNSGHTFGEADFKGSNALLYPRLGDWAVLKLAPTPSDPNRTEVVDAGIFDENWQFERNKK